MSFKSSLTSLTARLGDTAAVQKTQRVIRQRLGYGNRDLALDGDQDTRFLMVLIALMSFLAVLAFGGTFMLNTLADRWSSGLENKITIELLPEHKSGPSLSQSSLEKEAETVKAALDKHEHVRAADILGKNDIYDLIAPWVGEDMHFDSITLPVLISVEIADMSDRIINDITERVEATSLYARVETHQAWLTNLLRFLMIMKIVSLAITIIIAAITVFAVIGGMRARLAIHRKSVALLHHMGADDLYIAYQFQNHAMRLSFKSAALGTFAACALAALVVLLSDMLGQSFLPQFTISWGAVCAILIVPILFCALATLAARLTVLQYLSKMP